MGRYTNEDDQKIDIKLKVPLQDSNSVITGEEIVGVNSKRSFTLEKQDIKKKWFEQNELTSANVPTGFSIIELEIEKFSGRIIGGKGTYDLLRTPVDFVPI